MGFQGERRRVRTDRAERLANDAPAAFAEAVPNAQKGYPIVAVFNTPQTHNLIVCTLCSCYPLAILGMSPAWYKSVEYRARAASDNEMIPLDGIVAKITTSLQDA